MPSRSSARVEGTSGSRIPRASAGRPARTSTRATAPPPDTDAAACLCPSRGVASDTIAGTAASAAATAATTAVFPLLDCYPLLQPSTAAALDTLAS